MKNVKTAEVLKAADGDIIFGSHQSRQHQQQQASNNNNNTSAMIRQNLKDYSTKTLTSSQSDLSMRHFTNNNTNRVNSRSHSNSQQQQIGGKQRNELVDVNSTFIAGSLASAFVSSRKLSLSVDSTCPEPEVSDGKSRRRRTGKVQNMSVLESKYTFIIDISIK